VVAGDHADMRVTHFLYNQLLRLVGFITLLSFILSLNLLFDILYSFWRLDFIQNTEHN